MDVLDPSQDLAAVLALAGCRPSVLFLDYDGTLAPFHADPALARPYDGVVERLQGLQRLGTTRLVLVTGRSARELPPLLGLPRMPEVWGSHGWERLLPEGSPSMPSLPAPALADLRELRERLHETAAYGARCEIKPAGLAVHWRGIDALDAGRVRAIASRAWRHVGARGSLHWHDFDGGVEFRVPGRDKGWVVREVLATCPGPCAAAFLGDDLTDEDAFRAIRGRGIGVLVRDRPRATAASLRLVPPHELLDFLDLWTSAGTEGRP